MRGGQGGLELGCVDVWVELVCSSVGMRKCFGKRLCKCCECDLFEDCGID